MENQDFREDLKVGVGAIPKFFPLVISSEKFKKLLVFQSSPEQKIWLKDEEITMENLIERLEKA